MTETVFALASGAIRSAIAVIRISGTNTTTIISAIAGKLPDARQASLRRLRDFENGTIDHALVLYFPGPASFTGEDSAELHLHGGRAVVDAVSHTLIALGARPAEPGEFTRRAFLNGKLDLTAAEGIADLIEAETEAQRKQALRQTEGALARLYTDWTQRLIVLLAHQEALIDFSDEDLPADVEAGAVQSLRVLCAELGAHLADDRRGERLRNGMQIAILGAPNVGKSSLLNALAGREAAIVSHRAGTTRDVVEVHMDLAGFPLTLVDTAGLRETADDIEAEGIRRAHARAEDADLVLLVHEAGTQPLAVPNIPAATPILYVANKADTATPSATDTLAVSARTGAGVDRLQAVLAERVRALLDRRGPPPLTRARHRAALTEAAAALQRAEAAPEAELRAEDLRLALRAIGRITGQVGVEDVLDVIFGQFCIGK